MTQTIVVLKRAHFFSIDNDIIDVHAKTIGAIGIAVYAVLARYANRRTGECWPAIARIQRTLKLGRSSVKRYLKRLETAGLITVEERWTEEGDRTSNLYTLLNPEPDAIAQRQHTATTALVPAIPDVGGGGFTGNPPPVHADGGGGATLDPNPDPDPENRKKETTQDAASLEKTDRQKTCPHPDAEVHHFSDGIVICFHCYGLLEEATTETRNGHDAVVAA
jgi:DNA-binding MarR family transcriptional regulator